jgi:predicted RNase H-like nuclease (RuvC/YqgF family)
MNEELTLVNLDEELQDAAIPEESAPAPSTEQNTQQHAINLDVKHLYSDEEMKDIAQKMANYDKEIDKLEHEIAMLKNEATSMKKDVDNIDAERRKLSSKYRSGYEMRVVTAVRYDNYDEGIAEYRDSVTNELLKTESLEGIFSQNTDDDADVEVFDEEQDELVEEQEES